jgi:hypothetical protein
MRWINCFQTESMRPIAKRPGRFRSAAAVGWTAVAVLLFIGGCAPAAKEIGAAAAPVVVRSGLHEANEADDQQQLQRLANSPGIEKIGEQVGQHIGEGVAVGLFNQANKLMGDDTAATPDTNGNTPVAAGATTGPTSGPTTGPSTGPTSAPASKTPGAAALMGTAHGGGMNGFVKSSVQEAFLAATNPQFRAGEEAMAEAIGEGAVRGMITVLNKEGPAIGETIRKQLGPIVQELIREEIAPAVKDMLQDQLAPAALKVWKEGAVETLKLTVRPDLSQDVMRNAENMSIGAGRGTHQDLVDSGVLSPSGGLSPHLKIYMWVGAGCVAFILLSILSLLVLLNLLVLHHWRSRHREKAGATSKAN